MAHTYYARSLSPLVISQSMDYSSVLQAAYDQWRSGSNYIILTLFEEAVAAGRSIIYGTTSTGSHVSDFYKRLKEDGYQIVLLLCSCPDSVRKEAVEYRNEVIRFYQSSPEDAISKGKLFPERMGAYFAHADLIYLYWSDALFSPERLAAIWKDGELVIQDRGAMDRFVAKYEEDRAALAVSGKAIPPFESFLVK